ncbi:cation:proton antiporter [Flavobacterium aestuarii]|uniref:cation:proton antiporter n=1 Tax=Flavobacterium aestuarii TaxID=3149227 RepID=UPI0032B4833E
MTTSIIISICLLLILAYIFDITSSKTKIPSVILLLIVGWAVKQGTDFFEIRVPNLTSILPVLGTVGLILIVLEGSLELELNKSKFPFIGKTALVAIIPMLLFSFGLAFAFHYYGNVSFKVGLANAIPLAVISSAIAIPSAQNLISKNKEFITYESSLSDIFGVLLFNFITLNDNIGASSVGHFILEILVILIISFVATLGLAFLLSKIKHPVKFIPIILSIVLIYAVTKIYHLPGLIFILLFGLFLGNLDEIKGNKFIQKLQPNLLNKEVHKFHELTTEIAFLVRALFFLLFGYLIETSELLNTETIVWAIGICSAIFALRYIMLKTFKINIKPALFIAPRGLITILLFLSIPDNQVIDLVNNSLVIQVIILSALVMMSGLMSHKTDDENN